MVVTVSTVKDTLANVQRFVNGNLAGGIDHMFIFLDASDPEVEDWLTSRCQVTHVVCDGAWWTEGRPQLLNRRQNINANVVKALLSLVDWADWLFHIDADEIVRINRRSLRRVPAEEPAVRLLPLEVISQLHWDSTPTLFKRRLSPDELTELHRRGVIAEPSNSAYFRSHVIGKAGLRPTVGLWLRNHHVVDSGGERLKLVRDPGFQLLHLEAYSGEEFVRKWTNMIGSGPEVHFGNERQQIADDIKALLSSGADAAEVSCALTGIYTEHMQDPLPLLQKLDLVEEINPLKGSHRPRRLRRAQRDQLHTWLDQVRPETKRVFMHQFGTPAEVTDVLDRVSAADPPIRSRARWLHRLRERATQL